MKAMNFYDTLAKSGLSGSKAGKRAAELFNEVEVKAIRLSKLCPYSKEEIINRCLNIAKTTTNTFSEAFNIVEREIKNESN